ncbi:unnamed protein product [Bursaphelenchus okinawaensis]|uniref:Uncharacterized protein n=1 Tax=Bursaphelenchus okinawaensis TaxID=465554 RepID=A0A811JQD2_9BILA|nr:unnamed protein product [Bursaphelenchus okinawaensis]CAG9077594.1 unnamed protein product [Bursaphelenchus okinawaensis]
MAWIWWYLILLTSALAQNDSYTTETIQPGDIEHYLELFLTEKPTKPNVTEQILFAYLTTFNEPLGKGITVDYHYTQKQKFKISLLGDAYQVHSFVVLDQSYVNFFTFSPYEQERRMIFSPPNYLPKFAFTYRNLIFYSHDNYIVSQEYDKNGVNVKRHNTTDVQSQHLNYFNPDQPYIGQDIINNCFNLNLTTKCNIDRDDGSLVVFKEEEESYMYKIFDYVVPWDCANGPCVMRDVRKQIDYEIPLNLTTYTGTPPPQSKRIGIIPILTTESIMILKRVGWKYNSAQDVMATWTFFFIFGLFLIF